ncbi:MAG: fumarylacetoacetate hydrolase family protein [Pigmentiphaga sp.]|nr:fumarylacetoacetate hydrolase family protein [Pigmentiphaga sp.]
MRLCSYIHNGKASFGAIHEAGGIVDLGERLKECPSLLDLVRANALDKAQEVLNANVADFNEEDVQFIPLFSETVNIHCVGLNYAAHTAEAGMKQPGFPRTFFKIPPSLVGHRQALKQPTLSHQFDFEGELGVVIGKPTREATLENAMESVFGYTCFMDGSVRDYQLERTLDQGKNFYRSSSMGPYLVTADEVGDIRNLTLSTYVSGERMQHTTFDKMIFPVPVLISYLSGISELLPGDVIATGTPEGVGFKRTPPRWLKAGDTVEVVIDKVGTLSNAIIK